MTHSVVNIFINSALATLLYGCSSTPPLYSQAKFQLINGEAFLSNGYWDKEVSTHRQKQSRALRVDRSEIGAEKIYFVGAKAMGNQNKEIALVLRRAAEIGANGKFPCMAIFDELTLSHHMQLGPSSVRYELIGPRISETTASGWTLNLDRGTGSSRFEGTAYYVAYRMQCKTPSEQVFLAPVSENEFQRTSTKAKPTLETWLKTQAVEIAAKEKLGE